MAGDRFVIRAMTEADAQRIAGWRYPGEYSFYDADKDAEDLAELLEPAGWGREYFSVDDRSGELVGFLVFKAIGGDTDVGLGLRPDLTGQGLGGSVLEAALSFGTRTLGAERYALRVAAFNRRAISVYERVGFREAERFEHFTAGAVHTFVRMVREPEV